MINPKLFLDNCSELGYKLLTGTPCSYMSDFFTYLSNNEVINFIPAPNEGDAVALATGAYLAGQKSIVVFQNSGLGNAVNPVTSLNMTYDIPFIGIISLRGDPNGDTDEPQHRLMGQVTDKLLDTLGIAWQYFPTEDNELADAIKRADEYILYNQKPFVFILRKDSVAKFKNDMVHRKNSLETSNAQENSVLTRYEALQEILEHVKLNDVVVSTTGKTSRELYTLKDKSNNFYMVGSMGCVLSLSLGLSQSKNIHKIYTIDGDGAVLMRMGNMALAGQQKPQNLVHIVLDNGVHDSTGGQKTRSELIDFAGIAKSCGYQNIYEVYSKNNLSLVLDKIENESGLTFIRVNIKAGSIKNLGRPEISPNENARRFKKYISDLENN